MPRVARVLSEVARALAGADRPAERVTAALALFRQIVPYEVCALLELLPQNGGHELYVVPPVPLEQREELAGRLLGLVDLMREDVGSAPGPDHPAAALATGRPNLSIPVVGLNQTIGVVSIQQQGDAEYDEDSARLLSVVAAHLGAYLTSLRLHEEEMERARELGMALHRLEETDRRKDEFLAMLGHELRNPLGAINSALQVLGTSRADDHKKYHQLIDRQIGHLSRIVDDLLDAARVRQGKIVLALRPIDLNVVAERWREAFGTTDGVRGHSIEFALAPAPVVVEGDLVRLEQVLSNLMTNALRYTPRGGHILVTIAAAAGQGLIRIQDDGIGMSVETLGKVFELFTQADDTLSRTQGGLGLGLPLVRSLVEKHGGTVDATSPGPGRGTEFVVRLPLSEKPAVPTPPVAALQKTSTALRALVIEDNTDAREMLEEVLRSWGHDAVGAADGIAGLRRSLTESFDVVLIDIGLPQLDGYQVARRIREGCAGDCPTLIAMTGYGQPEDVRRAKDAGFDSHMVKPLDVVVLRQKLAAVDQRTKRSVQGGGSG